ncbi:MAG: ATP-binding protein [bacterium]
MPIRVAVIYWVLGSAWILITDALTEGASIQTVKGLTFVLASALLVYLLVRKASKDLLEARRVMETLLANIPGIAYRCRIDRHWTMLFLNGGCEELTGYAPEDLVGNRTVAYADLIHPDDRSRVRTGVEEAVERGEPFRVEYRILPRTGDEKWVWEQGRGVDPSGSDERLLEGIILDVTREHELERQMSRAQRLESVGQVTGEVAHDFNNILTAIMANCGLLLHELPRQNGPRRRVEQIQESSERAAALTRRLLTFARRDPEGEARRLFLADILGGMEGMVRRLLREDIELEMALEVPAPVLSDPVHIEQIVLNLVVNARDAMPEGGRLVIELQTVDLDEVYAREHLGSSPGEYVLLSVSDTGVGMDRRTQDRVFEPFFTTKEEGTGLGLSTVYGIVKQMGGNIWVYSEPGEGTTFKIYIPRAEGGDEEESREVPAGRESRGNERVLVVEDEESLRELAREILEDRGYDVTTAETGREALEVLEGGAAGTDLLLTDLVLPDMHGTDVARAGRSEREDLKVIFMSGYADEAIARSGMLAEGGAFLAKPFTPHTLSRKVREVLEG